MRHIKNVTENAPAEAFIWQWWTQSKPQLGAYVAALFGQTDGRSADLEDGDIGATLP